jgi:hypothetical protein
MATSCLRMRSDDATSRLLQCVAALVAVTLLAGGALARAESTTSDWRQTVFLYGMGARSMATPRSDPWK